MSGWYLYKTDKRGSLKIMGFIIVIVILSLMIRFVFPSVDHNVPIRKNATDSVILK